MHRKISRLREGYDLRVRFQSFNELTIHYNGLYSFVSFRRCGGDERGVIGLGEAPCFYFFTAFHVFMTSLLRQESPFGLVQKLQHLM